MPLDANAGSVQAALVNARKLIFASESNRDMVIKQLALGCIEGGQVSCEMCAMRMKPLARLVELDAAYRS